MKKIIHYLGSLVSGKTVGILALGCIIGIAIVLSFESLRYTQLVAPSLRESSPSETYTYTMNHPGAYLFLDVRTPGEYAYLHAVNSTSTPIGHFFDDWKTLPRDKNMPIFLICTTGRLAGVAYGFLQLHGFTNIIRVTGGMDAWVKEGLPANRGTSMPNPAFSLDRPVDDPARSPSR